MRAEDLDLKELLELDPAGGLIRFAGQRSLIFDAVAQGLLRKELIDTFGVRVARGILTRFGYAHGRRMAEAMRTQFQWESEEEWCRAGARLYALQGLFLLEPGSAPSLASEGGTWRVSYEAEQHVLHLGQSDYPVCWTLCGLASGYLSFATSSEVFALEDRCMGKGDTACHVTVRSAADWGPGVGDQLAFFKGEAVDGALREAAAALRRTEAQLRDRRRLLARVSSIDEDPSGLVTRSPEMRRVADLARTIAKVDSTVLIMGASGTGKERIARFVHEQSARADGPFIAINCGAISDTLLESELFGHVRGAFTGATSDRQGLFEAANGGTLFLDEVGDIPLPMQVKLLRALQEREIRRVGDNRTRPINVRIVTATNRDLGADVSAGKFRQDLYYRLKVVEVQLPPLCRRREDILPIARHFLAEAALRMKRPVEGISGPAADRLLQYAWPGNVRELANAMERAVAVMAGGRVLLEDLPADVRSTTPGSSDGAARRLDDVEREYILAVLDQSGGNRRRAARSLGIGVATLHRKLKSYRNLPPGDRNGGRLDPNLRRRVPEQA